MKKSLILTSLLVGAISFSGCGSENESKANSDSINLTPITTHVVCNLKAIEGKNYTSDVKYATEGDITVMCKNEGEFQLVKGVDTLTITDMKEVSELYIDGEKLKSKHLKSFDFKAGTIHRQANGTFPDGKTYSYDCTETYPSYLPVTLTDTSSIAKLFDWEGDKNNRIKTTCPDAFYEDEIKYKNSLLKTKGRGSFISNYTLIDSNNKKHLVTLSIESTFNQ